MEDELKVIKNAGIEFLRNLSSYDTHELLEDLLNYCDKYGLMHVTEEDVLSYLKEKLNIL